MIIDSSDFIAIRGWSAKVTSVMPIHEDGKLTAVYGQLSFFPKREEREILLRGKELSLDVLYQCHRKEVFDSIMSTVKPGKTIIVTGDLSKRSWSDYKPEITTNCWIDEFCVDYSDGEHSPAIGRVNTSNVQEYLSVSRIRYGDTCPHCKEFMLSIPHEVSMYCVSCDT